MSFQIAVQKPVLLALFFVLIIGCGGDKNGTDTSLPLSIPTADTQPIDADQKNFIYQLFQSEYLWSDQIPNDFDLTPYTTATELIKALRVAQDRWSFAMTQAQYDAYTEQRAQGFGIAFTQAMRIIYTVIASPAYGKLFRGDRIVRIDGEKATLEAIEAAAQRIGTPVTFDVERNDSIVSVTLTPSPYRYQSADASIVEYRGKRIGYLRYDAFTSDSVQTVERIFWRFKQEGIDELVIDLRYNGGGSVTAASILLDNITGQFPSQVQMILDWNERYKGNNQTYTFEEIDEQDGNELMLQRVFFLTTRASASASETAIHALKPYIDVVTIGEVTQGKNVGMQGRIHKGMYYFLVNFYVKNSLGIPSSANGIAPDCPAPDDIEHRFGDPQEAMLHQALVFIATGQCERMEDGTP